MTKTCRAKKRDQRLARDDRPAEDHLDELASHDRHPPRDRRHDAEPPVRVLVEAEDLAGERHAQRHDQQQHADDPRQLARVLERAEEKHLHHVDEHQGDHEVRAPAVHRAKKPAQRLLGVEDEEAPVGLAGRRHVDERQADPGHDLDHEEREGAAAEDVEPARRAAGHAVLGGLLQRRAELQAPVEPGPDVPDQAHGAPSGLDAAAATLPRARAWASSRRGSRGGRSRPCGRSGRARAAEGPRRGCRPRSTPRRGTGTGTAPTPRTSAPDSRGERS